VVGDRTGTSRVAPDLQVRRVPGWQTKRSVNQPSGVDEEGVAMSDLKYLDFDLAIEPSGDGYAARVIGSPVGTASAAFTPSFSDLEIENFLLRVGRSRHVVRRIESPEMAAAKAFGGRLFNDVFTGDVRGCLRSALDEASRQGVGLRVRLRLDQVPALADLPWEFLYNPGMNRFLGLSVETPLVRYIDLPERIRPLTVKPPLRVLMMISSPTDYPRLDVGREITKMGEALADLESRGLVVVERLEHATLAELQRRLRQGQYHIFHFVGHGGFDEQAQDGLLILEDQEERGRRVSAQYLGTLLHDHRPLRLAVLNACEGARASRSDPFAGTAQTLVQQGIPGVIAMQFEVSDEAAICFTREFYAAIAVGYPVDAALAEARKAIFAEVSEIEWGTPVLYMRSPDGCIFDVQQVSEHEKQQHHVASVLTEARTADGSGDEPTAILKLKEVLALSPDHAAASARLAELNRRQELYTRGRAAYDAGRWRDALEAFRQLDRDYQDVAACMAQAEAELAKSAGDSARRARAADLRRGATEAVAAERWDEAVERWETLSALEPDDRDARTQLNDARRQRDLAALYARGRAYYERRRWRDALAELHQIQQVAGAYKDVPQLMAAVEQELNRAEAERQAAYAQTAARPSVAADGSTRGPQRAVAAPAPPARAPWFVAGGILGAVAILALLAVGVVIVISMSGSGGGPAPAPDLVPDPTVLPDPVSPPAPAPGRAGGDAGPARLTAELRDTLQAAVLRADEAEMQAYRSQDPAPLYGSYTGEALQLHLAAMQAIAAANVFMVATLHNQQFGPMSISADGQQAEVQVTERWSANFHAIAVPGQPCMFHWHERDVPQTAFLQLVNGRWMIYRTAQDEDEPEAAACH
jgi:tetratricopeptide (TPR) repeat protein